MNVSQEIPLGPHRRVLELLYKIFLATGSWPSFQYVSARVWQELELDMRGLYYELSNAGWVRPAIRESHGFQLRDDTEIAVSIRGLTFLNEATDDVNRFVDVVRYLGDRAARLRPASPRGVERLHVTSEEIRLTLGLNQGDPALTRQAALLSGEAWRLWTGFSGPDASGNWTVTVDRERARTYRDVHTLIDFLEIGEQSDEPQLRIRGGATLPDVAETRALAEQGDLGSSNQNEVEEARAGTLVEVPPRVLALDTGARIELIRRVARALASLGGVDRGLVLRQFRISAVERPRESPYEFAVRVLEENSNERLLELERYLEQASAPIDRDGLPGGPWTANTFRLFCSHTHHIAPTLGTLKTHLAPYGIDAFVAHVDIEPAAPWETVVEAALQTCDALCAFLTPEFHASAWTDQELGWVAGRKRLVVCVHMGEVPYGFVAKWQAISPAADADFDDLSDAIFNIFATHDRSAPAMAEVVFSRFESVRSHDAARTAVGLVERLPTTAWNEALLARAERFIDENRWLGECHYGESTVAAAVAALVTKIRREASGG